MSDATPMEESAMVTKPRMAEMVDKIMKVTIVQFVFLRAEARPKMPEEMKAVPLQNPAP